MSKFGEEWRLLYGREKKGLLPAPTEQRGKVEFPDQKFPRVYFMKGGG